jgi:hypothetical protein
VPMRPGFAAPMFELSLLRTLSAHSSTTVFNVADAERGRDRHEEIARQDGAGVITHEGAPQLRPRAVARRRTGRYVVPYRPVVRKNFCAAGFPHEMLTGRPVRRLATVAVSGDWRRILRPC